MSAPPAPRRRREIASTALLLASIALVSGIVAAMAPALRNACGTACGPVPIITADRASPSMTEGRSVAQTPGAPAR